MKHPETPLSFPDLAKVKEVQGTLLGILAVAAVVVFAWFLL